MMRSYLSIGCYCATLLVSGLSFSGCEQSELDLEQVSSYINSGQGEVVRVKTSDHNHGWATLGFQGAFSERPVILAAMLTHRGGDTAAVRVRNVSTTQMQLRLEEEKSKDTETNHVSETVGRVAMRAGMIVNDTHTEIGEVGQETVNQPSRSTWHTVALGRSYASPVVLTQLQTDNDNVPAHIRIRNVTSTSFEYQIEEWKYQNGSHGVETVGFLVIEEGLHTLSDGRDLEAGLVSTNHRWKTVKLDQYFESAPVVISVAQTAKGSDPIVTRQDDVRPGSFRVKLEEEEAIDSGGHYSESIGYVAFDVSAAVVPQAAQGQPLHGLSEQERVRFFAGKAAFVLDVSRGGSNARNPAGPLANQTSCVSCHSAANFVGGSQNGISQSATRFGAETDSGFDPLEHLGGSLLQRIAIGECEHEQVPPEATVTTVRITPPVFGSGLIESIADGDIVANRNRAREEHPHTGGAVHRVKLLENLDAPLRVGRFGWKAQLATTLSFAADAANNEMGITNAILREENQPNRPAGAGPCDDGVRDPDDENALGGTFVTDLRDFMFFLAPPPQTPKSGMRGEQVFIDIGCATCHTPSFTTPVSTAEPALRQKTVKAYSDFLLHNMGTLGDGIVQGQAKQKAMRTPPLWDLKHRQLLLHDGRVFTFQGLSVAVREAITAHEESPQARSSAVNYSRLSQADKDDLDAFFRSLGRREFDHDDSNVIDAMDFASFAQCMKDSEQGYSPDHPCAVSDIDQDGDVDGKDLNSLLLVYQGPVRDCQCNGIMDLREILAGAASDANGDASPDVCHVNVHLFYAASLHY